MSLRTRFGRLGSLYEVESGSGRYLSMEGMRGLAILLVYFCHYDIIVGQPFALSGIAAAISRVVGEIGGAGVDLFFVLSGFLIYRSAIRPDLEFRTFFKRRAARIFPTFLVVFGLYLMLALVGAGERRVPDRALTATWYVLANLLFLPGVFDMQPLISAAWSLSYEWYFYISLPVLLTLLRASHWKHSIRLRSILALGIAHVLICIWAPHWLPNYKIQDGTFVRVILFIGGMALAEVRGERSRRKASEKTNEKLLIAVGATAIAAFCVQEAVRLSYSSANTHDLPAWFQALRAVLLVFGWVAFVEAGLRPETLTARALTSRPLRWLGNISYSFYLIHPLPIHFAASVLTRIIRVTGHPTLIYIGAVVPVFAVTFAAATGLFLLVERPLSLEGKLSRRTRQQPAAPIREPAHA